MNKIYSLTQSRSTSFVTVAGFTQAELSSEFLKTRLIPSLHVLSWGEIPLAICFSSVTCGCIPSSCNNSEFLSRVKGSKLLEIKFIFEFSKPFFKSPYL